MVVHARAPLSPIGRRRVVDRWSLRGGRWRRRPRPPASPSARSIGGWRGFAPRARRGWSIGASVPRRIPHKTPAERVAAICALRQLRMTAGDRGAAVDAALDGLGGAAARGAGQAVAARARRADQPLRTRAARRARPHRRQETRPDRRRARQAHHRPRSAGRPTHTDAAGVRRGTIGWESVTSPIDDYSRLAYVEVLPDEKAPTAIGFLERALAFFARHGITVERVMTDNGSAYRSHVHASPAASSASATCAPAPTGPGPTARPSDSSRRCCANGHTAAPTAQAPSAPTRSATWLDHYNYKRPHGSLSHRAAQHPPDKGTWERHLARQRLPRRRVQWISTPLSVRP